MPKSTQNFKLYELLKSTPNMMVSKEDIANTLRVSLFSVPVYIFDLKLKFRADIDSVYDSNHKRVLGYKLVNEAKIEVKQYRKGSMADAKVQRKAKKAAKIAKSLGGVEKKLQEHDITQYTDKEMTDLRSSLGLDTGMNGSGFSGNGSGDRSYE
jgi:hypothetical protein